ncbi:E3 ubiquitin-protein ligase RING1-like [Sesamum alatum]|uniref:RING-type E3 ubiquitin transferase n=1 Tax=Sesamum alatum TaxID=300844 RepID=A0AAE1YGT9_9LAMI|nr:E3 ubiquitin-protein ligase RING1-like [Sesamum alatum]
MFPGLDIVATKQINVKTPEALQTSLRERILDEDLIPFPLHDCFWTEQHLHGCPMGLQLSDEDELVDRIFDFVRLVDEKPENDDLKLVPVTMEIRKIVVVSEEEFGSWVSWNEVSQEAESLMARRPADIGTGELDTVIVNSDEGGRGCGGGSSAWLKEPCSICLEEFSDGVHGTRLPCRHMFHENCILRWLRRNHVCPLCRYQLPV